MAATGMFGGLGRNAPVFSGQTPPWSPNDPPPVTQPIDTGAMKPSFFGDGGTGRNIAGFIGDYLAQIGGAAPMYAPLMDQRRQDDRQQRQFEQMVEMQNRKPPTPTELQRNAEYYRSIGRPELAESYLTNRADPVQGITVYDEAGNQGLQFIRPSQMKGGDLVSPQSGGAVNPPASSDGGFLTFDQYRAMAQGMGGGSFSQWQGKFGTPVEVTSKGQMDALPSGTRFVAPDGSIRTKR